MELSNNIKKMQQCINWYTDLLYLSEKCIRDDTLNIKVELEMSISYQFDAISVSEDIWNGKEHRNNMNCIIMCWWNHGTNENMEAMLQATTRSIHVY